MTASDHEQHGQDRLHLGWYIPGEKICLGSGPMRMRMSAGEAADLASALQEMLHESRIRGGNPRGDLCGCYDSCTSADQVDEVIAAARQEFTGDFDSGPMVRKSRERQQGTSVLCPYHYRPLPCRHCEGGAMAAVQGGGPGD